MVDKVIEQKDKSVNYTWQLSNPNKWEENPAIFKLLSLILLNIKRSTNCVSLNSESNFELAQIKKIWTPDLNKSLAVLDKERAIDESLSVLYSNHFSYNDLMNFWVGFTNDTPQKAIDKINSLEIALSAPSISNSSKIQDGISYLHNTSNKYFKWSYNAINFIIVSQCNNDYSFHSGSWKKHPGLVHLSMPMPKHRIAETLVHEASHQYFYMAEIIGKTTSCENDYMLYSPATRTYRPLFALLLAFHAFGNISCYYKEVLSKNSDKEVMLAFKDSLNRTKSIMNIIDSNVHFLTDIGQSIYYPLKKHIIDM